MFFFKKNSNQTPEHNQLDITNSGFSSLPFREKQKVIASTQKLSSEFSAQEATSNNTKKLLAIFSAIFLSAIGYGILMVLISIRLEANVKNEILMSFSAITQIGAGVIFSKFLPELGRKNGMVKTVHLGSIISAICAVVLYQYFNYFFWLIIIYFLGTSFFVCGVTRNTIMIDLAPSKFRSLTISFGTILVAFGNALGPIILNLLKTSDQFISFLIAALFFLFSTLTLPLIKDVDGKIRENKNISLWRYIYNSPKIMFAGFSVSYSMSSASAFIIIYGLRSSMTQEQASFLLSILLIGTIFSVPAAYLADIFNRRFIIILSAFLSLILCLILMFNQSVEQIYILLFLLFACLSGIKIPAVVLINEKYKPTQRLAVNSAFSKFSLFGNVTGLLITGFLINIFGASGLWFSVAAILSLFLIFCLVNYALKIKNGQIDFKKLSIFNQHLSEEITDA